ncbi:MAG: diguanylate cyclase [Lachnospiraceae bacterium]|nr:diguanylate cyclase [Lachnospiraceae bacterium]
MEHALQSDYMIVYLEILAFCFLVLSVIYFNVHRDLGTEQEVIAFKWMLRVFMIALVSDAITHAQYRGFLDLPIPVIAFCYATYMFIFSGLLSLLWLVFAEMRFGYSPFEHKKAFILATIPILLVGFFSYASIFTGWFFTFDAEGVYQRGPLWIYQTFVPYVYFLFTSLHALYLASRTKSRIRKRALYVIASFVIFPTLGATLQLFVGTHPFVAPSTVISIFLVFLSIQSNMINHDALTGIGNRKSCDQYLEAMVMKADPQNPFYLYMADIDAFKYINDTYGHVEGDQALRITAQALRESVEPYHGFVSRFGGDEFLFVLEKENNSDPEAFIRSIGRNLERACRREGLSYTLQLSIGYTECKTAGARVSDLLEEADKVLYKAKAGKGGVRPSEFAG